jgi:hypothetical protein
MCWIPGVALNHIAVSRVHVRIALVGLLGLLCASNASAQVIRIDNTNLADGNAFTKNGTWASVADVNAVNQSYLKAIGPNSSFAARWRPNIQAGGQYKI